MLCRIVLCIITILSQAILNVTLEQIESPDALSCTNPKGVIFEFVNITSFVDENRYIRLNISWEGPKANFTTFEMMIDTNCSAIYGERNILVDQNFVIEPNMERLKHPAEPLLHGCKYDFEFYTEAVFGNQSCFITQVVEYTIPECVGDVCECGVADSPYKFEEINYIPDYAYEIKFYNTESNIDVNLETVFHQIVFTNVNSKTEIYFHTGEIKFNNNDNSFMIPFNEILSGNSYTVYIDLVVDNCEYHFSEEIQVPDELVSAKHYAIYLFVLLFICVSLAVCAFIKTNVQLIKKLRRYLPFLTTLPDLPPCAEELGVFKITKEVINSQYTPLEFIVNAHNYDKYEIPRNKIILKNKIGGGAFGHVYKAEIYELDNKPGYALVAAKKPIENVPAEELSDFLAEIDTMKKISDFGGHSNVIRILGCVTIESPFIMIMELVPCGSLKAYLSNLRKEWDQRQQSLRVQKNNQHFFPEEILRKCYPAVVMGTKQNQEYNMIVEHYLQPVTGPPEKDEPENLKYSDLAFDDYTGYSNSSGTKSYVTPDTPTTPGSSYSYASKMCTKSSKVLETRHKITDKIESPHLPLTPESITSSGLPSVTDTLLTPLESEGLTPLIDLTPEDKLKPVLDSKELQNFALQIANGMAFLEKIEITHRDLAARNILINEDKVLKISDFGMARTGVYINISQKKQPLRWMAPEAIENRRCDNKTDVWSFGVVLWEIGSLGGFPYKDLSNEAVIAHIMQGRFLERPETCTDKVYELMQKCWQKNPDNRPRFEEIVKLLDDGHEKIYVDFSKISPKYIFPPT